MFRALKRLFVFLGLAAERATETDAINQAMVERGIRDARARADKAHYANGQLASQVALLRDQVKRQERQRQELQGLLQVAAASNDEANGATYAEELANMEQELAENTEQVNNLEALYKQNTEIVAQSLREIQKFQRDFEQLKSRVAVGRSLEGLATMMKSSIGELQGMMGGELNQSMQQLRETAAKGEGQMRATLDLAREMGSNVQRQQEQRKARGAMLFQQYKQKMGMVQPEAAATSQPAPAAPERQKIAE
jgi:phage shock protein A